MIPKIIHQVWFKFGDGPSEPPERYQIMKKTWRDLHPDWTFMEWDLKKSRNLLKTHYPSYIDMFDGYIKDIYKVDAIRYFILHHYGGFYIDSDCTCVKNIEELRKYKTVLSVQRETVMLNNHFMGSVPNNEFFKKCYTKLSLSKHLQLENSFVSVMCVAGPAFLHALKLSYKKKNEIYVMTLEEERKFLSHKYDATWFAKKQIAADVMRVLLAGGALFLASDYITKKL